MTISEHPAGSCFWQTPRRAALLQPHALEPWQAVCAHEALPWQALLEREQRDIGRLELLAAQGAAPLPQLARYRQPNSTGSVSLNRLLDALPLPAVPAPAHPLLRDPLPAPTSAHAQSIFVHALGCLEARVREHRTGAAPACLPHGHAEWWDALRFANVQLAHARPLIFRARLGGEIESGYEPRTWALDALGLIDLPLRSGTTSMAWLAVTARALAVLGAGDDARAASRMLLLATRWPSLCPSLLSNTPRYALPLPEGADEASVARSKRQWQCEALSVALDAAGLSAATGNEEAAAAVRDAMLFGWQQAILNDEVSLADRWRLALAYLPPTEERAEVLLALGPGGPGRLVGQDYYA